MMINILKFKKLLFYFFIFLFFYSVVFSFLSTQPCWAVGAEDKNTNITTGPMHNLDISGKSGGWSVPKNESDKSQDIYYLIGMGINTILAIIGVAFLVLVIYGGFMWMTAHGDKEKIEKARKIIVESAIGLAVILAAYAMSYFIFYTIASGGDTTAIFGE